MNKQSGPAPRHIDVLAWLRMQVGNCVRISLLKARDRERWSRRWRSARSGLPAAAIVDKSRATSMQCLPPASCAKSLIGEGATQVGTTSAQFRALIDLDRANYARIITEKTITID